jgi:hypothetical protein
MAEDRRSAWGSPRSVRRASSARAADLLGQMPSSQVHRGWATFGMSVSRVRGTATNDRPLCFVNPAILRVVAFENPWPPLILGGCVRGAEEVRGRCPNAVVGRTVGVTQTKACPRPNQACNLAYRPCTWTLARPHCPALSREAQPGPAAFSWPGFSFLPLSVETSPMKPDTLARQTGSMCSRVASSPAQQSRRHGRGAVRRRCCSPGL